MLDNLEARPGKPAETTFAPPRPLASLLAERDRWWLWLPVGLGLGIGLYFAASREPPIWLGPAVLVGAAALGFLGRRVQPLAAAAIAAMTLGLGLTVAQLRSHLVDAPILAEELGPARIVGQVLSAEPGGERGARLTLSPRPFARLATEATPARVRIRLTRYDPLRPQPGDWIRLRAVLRPPPAPATPGAFDFARQAYFKRLGGVGYAVGHAEALAVPGAGAPAAALDAGRSWSLAWAWLRQTVTERVLRALPGTEAAVAAALMTGERGAILPEDVQAMRDSGLAHLLAISGLHVGLVAGILFFGLRAALALVPALALDHPIKKWSAVAAGIGALAYLFLAGATVPTQRAFLMIAIVLLAVVLDRSAISLRLVAWAAVVVLILAPESMLSASFQMSFAAVTALVAAYETLRERRTSVAGERTAARRLGLYVAGVALTSAIAIVATAPFAVYHFNRLAVFGLAANLVAVPLTAFWIMPCAVLAYLLMPFGLEAIALTPMGWGLEFLLAVARTVASWPGATVPVRAMPDWGLLLIVGGGLWLCLWRRPWRLLGLVAILPGLLSPLLARPPDVLASGDGRLLALRDDSGFVWLSSRRRARFEAEIWLRRSGQRTGKTWPGNGAAADGRLRCDSLGCIFRKAGTVTALVRDGRALDDDCRLADVMISLVSVPDWICRQPRLLVDRGDLWRAGGHAIWLSPREIRVETVAEHRGRRPWTRAAARPDP